MEENQDFYCYLKKKLPNGYEIRAFPSPAYYSEWLFDYIVFKDGFQIRQYRGDFRLLEPGELVNAARELILENN